MDEITSERHGVFQGSTGHDRREKAGGVEVARTVEHIGQVFVRDFDGRDALAAQEIADAGFPFPLDAFEHYIASATVVKGVDDVGCFLIGQRRKRDQP